MGAPNKRPLTKKQIELIREATANGATRTSCAGLVGWSVATLYRWMDKDDRLKNALEVGKAQDYQVMMNKAREKALEGSYQHLAGYMRVIHNVNMGESGNPAQGGAQIVVNLNLGDANIGETIEHNIESVALTDRNAN